jgi:hypothetical protein
MNRAKILTLHAAARYERSAYVHCLLQRMWLWLREDIGRKLAVAARALLLAERRDAGIRHRAFASA